MTIPSQVTHTVQGALAIRGGYLPGCPEARNANAMSSLQGPGNSGISLQVFRGDLTLERLQFGNFTGINISPVGFVDRSTRVGQILVQRCAWFANQHGLLINTRRHDVRVENSLFIGGLANGGNILTGAGLSLVRSVRSLADVDITSINNTAVGNSIGVVFGYSETSPTLPKMINTSLARPDTASASGNREQCLRQ